jgi:hypothetical protein
MARSVCELNSGSRWAVTGTPIQNHLSDLAALLKFIRAHPYDDVKRFDTDISRLWKSGEDEEAVRRLKHLASCLVLRRAKRTINLPERHDMICAVDFSKAERALYDQVRQQTIVKIDDVLQHETEVATSGIYINFLQQIESMRLICNLGTHYITRHDKPTAHDATEWSHEAQAAFNIQREMETIVCSQCSSPLDVTETLLDEIPTLEAPQFSRCSKFACADCSARLRKVGQMMVCGHSPRCPIAPVYITYSALEDIPDYLSEQPKNLSSTTPPSKVEALIADLESLPLDVKWYTTTHTASFSH